MNIKIGKGGIGSVSCNKGGSGRLIENKYIDLIPLPNNLRIHFDPIFYKNFGSKYDYFGSGSPASQLDPWFLEQFRDYNISNVVPSRPLSQQWIQGGSLGSNKAQIVNNTLSYIKDPNNNDVERERLHSNYLSIFTSQLVYGFAPPVENKKPFLILKRDDDTGIYRYGPSIASTLNIFVKLQRPLAHKAANGSGIIREKKGIFCTYGIQPRAGFSIGYRSPHHYINGDRTYKFQFEPFSFVFSLGQGFSPTYSRPCYQTLMTDFKFKFNEMYMLTVVSDGVGNVLIYVNGELQSVANVPFNPIRNRSGGGVGGSTHIIRKQNSPIGPNFIKFDGTTYPSSTTTSFETGGLSIFDGNAFIFGKSNLNGSPGSKGNTLPPIRTTKRRKRFLNNIDLGVINVYNTALSQSQISQFYENFRYRYE